MTGSRGLRRSHAGLCGPAFDGFVHAQGDDEPRGGGQRRNHPDCGMDAEIVGENSGEERADGESEVPPESVNANCACSPARVGDVADAGQEGG